MSKQLFVGVDVSKLKLDVSILIDNNKFKHRQFDNSHSGHLALLNWLKSFSLNLWVSMEATGHYSEVLAEFLYRNNILVSVINPFKIKQFSKLILARNKNDIIDSKIIALFATKFPPQPFQPRPVQQKNIRELTQLMDTLKQQRTQLANQLASIQAPLAKKELKSLIKSLDAKILRLKDKIFEHVTSDPELFSIFQLLTSIKGVGQLSAIHIIAYLPDISQFQHAKQLAAFVGLSPQQRQSGKFEGKTCLSKFGNYRLRKALYMPALSAKNHNPHLKPFVTRLQNNGLAPKAIVGAVMRKLIHIIFGMLKSGKQFDPNLV